MHREIRDLAATNKLCARARVGLLTTWSTLAGYPSRARRACDISPPDTICSEEERITNHGAFERSVQNSVSSYT